MSSEDKLIQRVCRMFPVGTHFVRTGIGDDAAVLRPGLNTEWVVTTDAFLEGVHFIRAHPPKSIGYKALARATSDIAAMGARPRYFLLTLALPESCANKWLDEFLSGMALASKRFGLALVGGDTTKHRTVMASLTVIGEADSGRAILRSGARPGDLICVSGRLGEAELGLRLALKGPQAIKRFGSRIKKHLYPEPRLALGQWLAVRKIAASMIDTSDGLSTDLGHICKASGVGARVWADKIPTVSVPPDLRRRGLDALRLALHGGEDYELLFTVRKRFARRVPRIVAGVPVTVIGEITAGKEIVLIGLDGQKTLLRPGGWDPFRKP